MPKNVRKAVALALHGDPAFIDRLATSGGSKAAPKSRTDKNGNPVVLPRQGNGVIWPKGVEERYDISAPTRWRWEKDKKLPPRDVNIGGKTGWKPETLAAAESKPAA